MGQGQDRTEECGIAHWESDYGIMYPQAPLRFIRFVMISHAFAPHLASGVLFKWHLALNHT